MAVETTKPTLGDTALEAWRNWRALPWQNLPCFGQALGVGEFCWQANQAKPAGQELHRVINELVTRPATESEEDEVWDCMLNGALRIYTRRNGIGIPKTPVTILHEMTGYRMESGLTG